MVRRRDPLLLLALVVVLALTAVPLLWVLTSAVKSDTEIFGGSFGLPQHWRWDNFATAWTSANFGTYFGNSLLIAIGATVCTVVVAGPAGYAFAKLAGPKLNRVFLGYLVLMTLPVEGMVVPLFYQMRAMNLVDSRLGLMLVVVAVGVPLGVLLMRNSFRDLPDELAESARVDGAGEGRIFATVMLPLARPAVLAVAVFSFLGAWNEYQLALLLLISDEKRTIPTGLVQFQNQNSSDYGALFAGITIAMIPSVLVYVLLQRSFDRGLVAGALK